MSSESELQTDKNTAVHWFKTLKAFDQIVENKSYAQALSCNLNESKLKCKKVLQPKSKIIGRNKNIFHASKFAKISCSKQNSLQKPQINNEGSVPVERYGNCKNYPKTVTGGSVTGAAEAMSPVQLTNRFQPLLLINSADDVCSSQSRLTDQTKNIFMGKKTKLGNCKGILKMLATSSPHKSNLLGVVCQKLPYLSNQVALISPCWPCSPKINWWGKKNKTGSLEGEVSIS